MPTYDVDARRRALLNSPIGLRDGGQTGDDWSQKQLNQLDWEAQQALGAGLLTPAQVAEARSGQEDPGPNWIQKYLLGLWGDEANRTGGALETIEDVVNAGSLNFHVGALVKTELDAASDPEFITPAEMMREPSSLLDDPENLRLLTTPGQAWNTGKVLYSWWQNLHNGESVTRVTDEVDLWDSMGELGFYRPLVSNLKPSKLLAPGLLQASLLGSATDALGLTEQGSTLGGVSDTSAAESLGAAGKYLAAQSGATPLVSAATQAVSDAPDAGTLGGIYNEGQRPLTQARDIAKTVVDAAEVPTTGIDAVDAVGADLNYAKRAATRYILGDERQGYALSPVDQFMGNWMLDTAMDPTTYLTFGVSPGLRLPVKLAKSGTFRMGETVVRLATAPKRGKVTLTKAGNHFFHMAAADLAAEGGVKWERGVPLIETAVDGEETAQQVLKLIGSRFDKYREYASMEAMIATARRYKSILQPFVSDSKESVPALVARLEALGPSAPPSVQNAVRNIRKAESQIAKTVPEDLFEEAMDDLHRPRYLYSPEAMQEFQQKITDLPVIGKAGRWFFNTFDHSWDMPPDAVELANESRRRVQLELDGHVQRYTEAFQHLNQRQREQVAEVVESRWLLKNGYPHPIRGEYNEAVESAAQFFTDEMDEILANELSLGFAINSVEDYVSHMLTIHPNAREQLTNFLRKVGEENPNTANKYAQQRMIATMAQVEDLLGEGVVEKDAFKILALRRRATLELEHQSKFYQYTAERYGVPAAVLMMMSRGEGGNLIRAMSRRNADGVHEIIPSMQMFEHKDSTLRELGFKPNDFQHNAELLRYLALPVTKDPGGRFSPEGVQLAEKLGVDPNAKLFQLERTKNLDIPSVGIRSGVKLRVLGDKIKFKVRVKLSARGPAGPTKRMVDLQFTPSEALRMLDNPEHPGWRQIIFPGGMERHTAPGLEAYVTSLDRFLRTSLDGSLAGLVPDLEERLMKVIHKQVGVTPELESHVRKLVVKSSKSVEVRKLVGSLPQFLVEHARRTRVAAGDLTSEVKASRSDMSQIHHAAAQMGFTTKLLDQYIELVIGKPTIDNAEEAHTIIDSLLYWTSMTLDKDRLKDGMPDMWRIGGQPVVKFTLATQPKVRGNPVLPELLDQDLGIPTVEPRGPLAMREAMAQVDADGMEVVRDPAMRIVDESANREIHTPGSTREAVQPPSGRPFRLAVERAEREVSSKMTELHPRLAPLREMTYPPRRKGVLDRPKPRKSDAPADMPALASKKTGLVDDQFETPSPRQIGELDRHASTVAAVLDSDEMKQARRLRSEYLARKLVYEKILVKWRANVNKRRKPDGTFFKTSEGTDLNARRKAILAKYEAAKAAYDHGIETQPIWLKPVEGKQQQLTYRELLGEQRKLTEIRKDLSAHRQRLVRLYKRWEHHQLQAPTGRDALESSGLARNVPAGESTFRAPGYLDEARRLRDVPDASPERLTADPGVKNVNDLDRLQAARTRASDGISPTGITDGQLRPKTGAQTIELYLPESVARLARDLQAPDIPPGISRGMRQILHGFDQAQNLFKTNLMLPWGAYWNRNLMSNTLLLYTGAGLRFLRPEVMSDFFKLWFYGLARYSDLPAVMGMDIKSPTFTALGKQTISGMPLGRGATVAEIFDDARHAGVLTGVVYANSISTMDNASLPDWAKRLVGATAGVTAGGMVGIPAGALAGEVATMAGVSEEHKDRVYSATTLLSMLAGATLGAKRLTTSGVPIRSRRGVTAMLQSSFKPLLRNGEMATESPLRLLLYMETLKRTGSPLQAKQAVHRHMNDWMNLGVTERRVGRRVFPFYTWTKFATQQSFRSVLESPDKVNDIFRTFEEWNHAHEYDPEDVPEWYHEKLVLMGQNVGKDKDRVAGATLYSGFGATYEDVSDLGSFLAASAPLQTLAGKLMARGPLGLTSAIDGLLDRDSFTGRAISIQSDQDPYFAKGEGWETAPTWLQAAVGYRAATPNTAAVVNPTIAWAMGKIPPSRLGAFARDIRRLDPESRKRLDYDSLARTFLGVNAYAVDPKTQRYFRNKARIDAMAVLLKSIGWAKSSTVYSDRNKTDETPGGSTRGRRRKQWE